MNVVSENERGQVGNEYYNHLCYVCFTVVVVFDVATAVTTDVIQLNISALVRKGGY